MRTLRKAFRPHRLPFTIVIFLSFSIPFLAFVNARADDRETVAIGLIFPLTGAMSSFGEDIAKALPLLEKKFNAEQSKYNFQLLLEDGKFGESNAAITAARHLVDINHVRFLIVGSSGEILQIASFVESAHVLAVAGFASHPAVKNAGDYIFRTYIDIDRGIQVVVSDVLNRNISRVAVVTETSSFTSAVSDSLRQRLGDRIVSSQEYALGDQDLNSIIARARSTNPQV